jgi:anaerobic magnesium-protoporphyrin IX monomethyl ester cyclase
VSLRITLCSATLGEDGCTEPPLGPLYVAAALEGAGVEVDFRDFQLAPGAHGFSGRPLAAFLADHARIVAISCFVDMLPAVVDATRRLYRARPDTVVVLGGPGPTAHARPLLETYPWITAVVRGEGEETVVDCVRLLSGARAGPVAGMSYRRGGEIVDGPERARIRAIDALPLPAYHLVDWPRYTDARIVTTRGCSYRCSFCDVTFLWGARSVFRDLGSTVDEMELLRDRGGKASVSIVDDTFVLNRERVRAFCRLLIERGARIAWGCFGRINLMTPELIELMARAGCRAIFYGIDSGSPAVLRRTLKKIRAEEVLPVLRASAQHFDKVEASFIWGYPFESLDDFKQTLDMAGEASLLAGRVNVQLHMLSPLPSSPIYQAFTGELREPDPEDQPWLLLPAALLDERAGAVRRLIRAHPRLYPGFFTFPTPAKRAKQELLQRAMRALNRTIGDSFLKQRTARLLVEDDAELQADLLGRQRRAPDRIGVGLAISFFSRVRQRASFEDGRAPRPGTRGPGFVRRQWHSAAAPIHAR